jgi:phenylpropionate dioxygenase-like ring-hydroxylating dioxygenase large terminal subunit
LERFHDGVGALLDRCPHRGVALSLGTITDGCLACPFHGWRFGADAEIKLGGPLMGLVEYRSSNDSTYGLGFATPVKIKRHQAIAGVRYRF